MKKGYIYIILTALIFSTMEIALKLVTGIFAPMQITMLRFFLGGILLIPFALSSLKKSEIRLNYSDFKYFAMLGFVCVVLSMVLYQMAVSNTTASAVAVVFSGNPIFVAVIAFFILKEPIHKHNVIALIIEVLGIIVIINPLNNKLSPVGMTLTILSAVTFALYAVLGKRKTAKFGGLVVTCLCFIFGGMQLLIIILLGNIDIIGHIFASFGLGIFEGVPILAGINLKTLPVFIYICAVNSALGYVCHMKALEKTSAHETSLVFFLKPIIAPILALIVLGESISLSMFIGILFFLAGSLTSVVPELIQDKKHNKELL